MRFIELKVPIYVFFALFALIIAITYHNKKERRFKPSKKRRTPIFTITLTSCATVVFVLGFAASVFMYPQLAGLDTGDISRIEQSLYRTYSHNQDYSEYLRPKTVTYISGKLWENCNNSINCFKNRSYKFVRDKISYERDITQFGKAEHYLTPLQTLAMGKGDCEDQAFLLGSILANYIEKVYFVEYNDHAAVGVCENGSLVRYDPTMPEETGKIVNDSKSILYHSENEPFLKVNCS